MSFTQEEAGDFTRRSTFRGVAMFVSDLFALSVYTFLAVWFTAWWLQLVFSVLAATVIAIIFVIGHDAAHNSLTPHRRLNRLIGRFAFLPSLHPFSLWVKLHNVRHHLWTNLHGKDDVWTPYDLAAYRSLPWPRRWLYRFYRSPLGPLLYYLIEFWWKKFSWPTRKHYGAMKRQYLSDTLWVYAFVTVHLSLLVYGAGAGWFGGEPRPWWNSVFFGAVLPFFIWNVYSGMSIFLHHTHPSIVWYDDEQEWRQVSKELTAVHAVYPKFVQRMFHFIMEHSVHHLRPSVPLYRLSEAQSRLEEMDDGQMVVYRWTPAYHLGICRRCKLYDFAAKRWMNFRGEYTSTPPKERSAAPAEASAAAASDLVATADV